MSWIKRNLYFLIGALIALILMGLSGWYLYSKWQLNNEMVEKLNQQYQVLQQLNNQNPHPGSGDVDNIKAAKEQQQELRDFVKSTRKHFQSIPPIPAPPEKGKLIDQAFSTALSRTIDQMQRDATNASVNLPPVQQYSFSFETEKQKMGFPPGSLEPLSVQLGEVKAICDVLFAAKINSLDSLRRERVSSDEAQSTSPDFISEKSVTNDMGVLTPYELSFRCFTPELASVLSGFGNSQNGILVRSVNVELAGETLPTDLTMGAPPVAPPTVAAPVAVPVVPPAQQRMSEEAAFRARYGLGPRGARAGEGGVPRPPPVPTPTVPQPGVPTTPATTGKGGLQTVLDEKQLKVNMMLVVVKLAPPSAK